MTSFKLELQRLSSSNDAFSVFQAKGKLSLETVNEFIQTLRPDSSSGIVLDMSGVSFLDSAGVGSLVSMFVNRRNNGKTFALASLTPQSAAVVAVAGLQKLLPIYKTTEEALARKT